MNIAMRKPLTVAQFLDWEARQELRYEFNSVEVTAMTGGTFAHDQIAINIAAALVPRLRGTPCRLSGSNVKIRVAESIRYPDAFVTCTKVAPDATVVREPVIVFEVLSPSTSHIDLVEKNAEYRATQSVRRYVILEQAHASALVFVRDGEAWVSEIVAGDGAVLRLPEIGVELPLAELYADVELQNAAVEPT